MLRRLFIATALCSLMVVSSVSASTVSALIPAAAPRGADVIVVGGALDDPGIAVTFPGRNGTRVNATIVRRWPAVLELRVPSEALTGDVGVSLGGAAIGTFPFTVTGTAFVRVSTLAAGAASHNVLREPGGPFVALPSGTVYVADAGHHQIKAVLPTGEVRLSAGTGQPGYIDGAAASAQFRAPASVAIDPVRNVLYIADSGNHVVRRMSLDGNVTTFAGSGRPEDRDGTGVAAGFKTPAALAIDALGNLYVADSGNDKIRFITPAGVVTTIAGAGTLKRPRGVAVNDRGVVFVADTGNHVVKAIENGIISTVAGTGHPGLVDGAGVLSEFKEPGSIAVAEDGSLLVADTMNHAIRRIVMDGAASSVTTLAGSAQPGFVDGEPALARFHEPAGISVNGAAYIADAKNDAIRLLLPALALSASYPRIGPPAGGTIVRVFGSGFVPGQTIVRFGPSPATAVTFVSSTELLVTVPPGVGTVDLHVGTPVGERTLAAAFRYLDPPAITTFAPAQGAIGTTVVVSGHGFDPELQANVISFGGVTAPIVSGSATQLVVTVPAGAATGRITITTAGGTATSATDFVIPLYVRITVAPAATSLAIGEMVQQQAAGVFAGGTSEPLPSGVVWTSSNPAVATVDAGGQVTAIAAGTATITATFAAFTATAAVSVHAASTLPPDPATIAPAIDPTVPTSFASSIRFLYSGPNPVQSEVAAGAIAEERAAVLRGRVVTRDGEPLSGVRVSVHDAATLGHTLSRADGRYDLVANGGGLVVLEFAKEGYLPAQRQRSTAWNRFAPVADMALVPLDTAVTPIAGDAATIQIARGTAAQDADGSRRATILFPPHTRANMRFSNGSVQPLPSMSVRATEYSVGVNGPKAMPAALPPQSGYTYCVELSVDEAIAAGASSVEFSDDVAFYVENFLGFPVGGGVPAGYYDRDRAAWVPVQNGRVVKILSIDGGLAAIDSDADGVADDDLDISDDERRAVAGLYAPGQTLWRVWLEHFSPLDLNWAIFPGAGGGAQPPNQDPPKGDHQPDDPTCRYGSVIQCESQALGERIAVAGTPFTLTYNSARIPGRLAAKKLEVSLTAAELPLDLEEVALTIEVAGKEWTRTYAPATNLKQQFEWDGKDAYGRAVLGDFTASVTIGYQYRVVYRNAPPEGADFAVYAQGTTSIGSARAAATLVQEQHATLRMRDVRAQGLGGWSLDVHHTLDVAGNAVLFGNGEQRTRESVPGIVTTVAGSDRTTTCTAAGLDGIAGTSGSLSSPWDLVAAPDGSVYVLDRSCVTVNRIAPDGRIYHVAGKVGQNQYSGDGGPAKLAGLYQPESLAVGPDGSVYISHSNPSGGVVLRRIAPNGTITTIANALAQQIAPAPDGALWLGAANGLFRLVPGRNGSRTQFSSIQIDGVAVDPSGVVYATTVGTNVYRLSIDGVLRPFANLCSAGGCLPGGFRHRLTRAPDGRLFVTEMTTRGRFRVYEVTAEGKVSIAVDARNGDGVAFPTSDNDFSGDSGPASDAGFDNPFAIAAAADGSIYVADTFNRRVRKIAGSIARNHGGEKLIPSAGGELVYLFDESGRHLRTADARLGTTLLAFGYDGDGRLATVTDVDGRETTIEHEAGGPAVITAPGGQQTKLAFDGSGYLASVTDPASHVISLTHASTGLLTELRDPKGQPHTFSYTADGLLRTDSDPAGGSQALTFSQPDGNQFSVAVRTMMGRTTTYLIERLADGDRKRTTTSAAGLKSVETRAENISTVTTAPDGTIVTRTPAPDPRFGMDAPLGTVTFRTPAALTMTASAARSVVLADPNDPLSLQSEVTTTTVNGKAYRTTFDATARTVTERTPLGRTVQRFLDSVGRTVRLEVPGLTAVEYAYDGDGRLQSVTHGSRTSSFSYDDRDRLETMTDGLSRTVHFEYDEADRLVKQILPGGRAVLFAYDANGNPTSITPPGRPAHLFTFTPADLAESYEPPRSATSGRVLFDYDADHQLRSMTQPDGSEVRVLYEDNGRLSRVETPSTAYAYSYLPSGNLGSVSAGAQTLTYGYDGPLPKSVHWSGTVAGAVAYTYDNNFRLTGETVAGAAATYAYDDDGLLTQAGALTLTRHAANGLLTGTTVGVVNDTWTYTTLGETESHVASAAGTALYSESVTRDAAGRITDKVETAGTVTTTLHYDYDLASRLSAVARNGLLSATYGYDDNGNRTTTVTSIATVSATYDDQDRLLTAGSITYTYTPNGDLRTRTDATTTTTYTYDALGNLRTVDLPSGSQLEYLIDGQNRRIGRKLDGTLQQAWLYGDQLRIVAELDGANTLRCRFVYGTRSNIPDTMIRHGVTYRILSDHLGSPRLVVNTTDGTIAQQLDYDPFGAVTLDTNPGFQPFGFAGGLYDQDTHLVRFGVRDYDPHTGRWTAKEGIPFEGHDPNAYEYVFSDPINQRDANGRWALVDELGGAVIGATVSTGTYLIGHLIKYRSFKCVKGKDLAVVFGVGLVAGFFATDTFGASVAVGASSNVAQYVGIQLVNDREISGTAVVANGVSGALGGAGGYAMKAADANTIENIARGPSRIHSPDSAIDSAVKAGPRNVASGYIGNADPDCGCQ
jgi:RHS repeat-associated protein